MCYGSINWQGQQESDGQQYSEIEIPRVSDGLLPGGGQDRSIWKREKRSESEARIHGYEGDTRIRAPGIDSHQRQRLTDGPIQNSRRRTTNLFLVDRWGFGTGTVFFSSPARLGLG